MGSKDGRERSLGSGGQCVRQLGFPPQEDLGRFPHHLVGVRLVFVEIESYPFVTRFHLITGRLRSRRSYSYGV